MLHCACGWDMPSEAEESLTTTMMMLGGIDAEFRARFGEVLHRK